MIPGAALEDPVREKGLTIFRLMEAQAPKAFHRSFWVDRMLEGAMDRPELKVALFRFIDVLPALSTTRQLSRHIREYFLSGEAGIPGVAKALLSLAASGPAAPVAAAVIRRNITRFSKHFIAGKDPGEGIRTLRKIWSDGRAFTVDLLGEAAVSEAEADAYRDRYLSAVESFGREAASWPARDPERERHFPRLNVSVKISSLYSRIGAVNFDDSVERVACRLRPIFRKVKEAGGGVHVDMETVETKEIAFGVVTGLLGEPEFREWEHVGITLQAYLTCARDDLERLIRWAKERGRRLHVRLVKGAYWEYEKTFALQRGWPVPVYGVKSHTDWSFEKCTKAAFENHEVLSLAVASHNVRSIANALVLAERLGVPADRYEFQCLYGMAEPAKRVLVAMGHPVREYCPVGELIPGMAYLVRRLLENTSNEGFLRKSSAGNLSWEELLAAPEPPPETPGRANGGAPGDPSGTAPFANEPPLDFSIEANRAAFRSALAKVRKDAGKERPAVYGGREHRTAEKLVSRNPHDPRETVCVASSVTPEMADEAVAAARKAQPAWGNRRPGDRAEILFRAAAIARGRRLEAAAREVLEVGKNWAEADADVCEAIDYLEYYGREMIRLGKPARMGNAPGEVNRYFYQPRGVGVVIAPWNFPLAISVGMTSAALVAGNAVLYKPSSLSLGIGWLAFEILREAGIPDGVLGFLPGRGSVAGDRLVEHPHTDFTLFTGSLAVGLGIVEAAGRTRPGQKGPKKAVIETGGKNAIIVDGDADLDQAVPAVIRSAFGYQGQKCSACSRAIVLSECYDRFLARLCEAVKGIPVGDPCDPKHFLGPVVDESARKGILEYIEIGKRDGRILVQVPVPDTGWYVPPTVFVDLPSSSRVLREEIFGPVLSVVKVEDIDAAIAAANDTIYALTGGLFSRSPANIEKVAREFSTGNLYINRGITGAVVGRQPFGGFRMSGVGSKAGGPDYLLQFLEPRVVTENTLRRGFTPEDVS